MATFDSVNRQITAHEELIESFSYHERKMSELEEQLVHAHYQVRQTTDILGNNSRDKHNQSVAGDMMGHTLQSNSHLLDILREGKRIAHSEKNRLSNECESLYRQRRELN